MPDIGTMLTARGWPVGLALVALGVLAGLGQAPWGLWPLTVVGLICAFVLVPKGRAFGRALLFGAGYFGWSLQWIVEPFLVDIATHGWMAPFALVLMALGGGLFWAAGMGLGCRLGGPWGMATGLALAEAVRALALTGFPWAMPGHALIGTPLAQLSAFGGPFLLNIIVIGLAAAFACLRLRWAGLITLSIPAILWPALEPGPASRFHEGAPVIRIAQPNAPQDEKWDPIKALEFHERLLAQTAVAPRPDLVVWPETSVPWLLDQAEEVLGNIAARAGGAPVVVGIQRREGAAFFNSLLVTGRNDPIAAIYDKWHLVPFGEYIPGGELAARLGLRGLAAQDGAGYAAGAGPSLISIPGIGRAMPLICYEGIFAEEVNAAPGRARFLLLITNDGWFGTRAGPQQHFAQARLRAIEQGLPMVRAANTGISAIIDGKGRVIGALPLGVDGVLDLPLPPALAPTPYTRVGDWPVLGFILVTFCGAIVLHRRKAIDGAGNTS